MGLFYKFLVFNPTHFHIDFVTNLINEFKRHKFNKLNNVLLQSNAWLNNVPYLHSADNFVKKAMEWNGDNFGNIFARKKKILARLGGFRRL